MTTLARTRLELPAGAPGPTRLARGIWSPITDPALADRCRRTLAGLPPHCCVVGLTNAALRNLWIDRSAVDARLEIAFLESGPCRSHTRSRRPEIRSSRRIIPPDHLEVFDDIAVASRAWTWRDLVTRLSVPAVVALGDGLLRDGVTRDDLADVILRRRGRPGTDRAVRCLDLLDERSRSRPESHTRVELALGGPSIPPFEVNVAITDGEGGWLAEPDLSNEQLGIAVEYQGDGHAGLDRMRRDITRALHLGGRRWDVVPVGPADVFHAPDRLRAAVRRLAWEKGWRGA